MATRRSGRNVPSVSMYRARPSPPPAVMDIWHVTHSVWQSCVFPVRNSPKSSVMEPVSMPPAQTPGKGKQARAGLPHRLSPAHTHRRGWRQVPCILCAGGQCLPAASGSSRPAQGFKVQCGNWTQNATPVASVTQMLQRTVVMPMSTNLAAAVMIFSAFASLMPFTASRLFFVAYATCGTEACVCLAPASAQLACCFRHDARLPRCTCQHPAASLRLKR